LIEGRAGDGKERKANGEKTGHQVSQPAKEDAERQNPVKTRQEEVITRISLGAGICTIKASSSQASRSTLGQATRR
jgi:hypothetical protein